MIILIDIGHPAHVHLFKNLILSLKKKGHDVHITARDKEIVLKLLNYYKFDYTLISRSQKGLLNMGKEMIQRDYNLFKLVKKIHPDLMIAVLDPSITQIGKLFHIPTITLTDTEHATITKTLTIPFSDVICTPSCYKEKIGRNQIHYNSYHELAYLHPHYFTPDVTILDEIGLTPEDRFIVVRFVSFQASHDIGHHGIRDKVGLVKALEPYGRILITSEGPLPPELEEYRIRVSPEKLHDLLYYATLYVGDGGTTASESAVLGTHAIHISTTAKFCGNFSDLNRYGLLWTSESDEDTIRKAIELLQSSDLKNLGHIKRDTLNAEKIDFTAFMIWFIERYPESDGIMRDNPDFQNRFRPGSSA